MRALLPLMLVALGMAACSDRSAGRPETQPAAAPDTTPAASTNTATIAAAALDVVPVDLNALIGEAAGNPNQFAVNVPHTVTTASSGSWSASGSTQSWTYAVQIRGAISLSFHAPRMHLPGGTILTVRSASTTTTYRGSDADRGDFWSRVQPGDTLEFQLDVPAADRAELVLEIASFQAGFRGLSPSVPNHPSITRVRAQAAGDPDTPCVQNYACSVTPGNSPVAQATVALLISNQYQCTGTLLNNIAQDNTPYVLTARHCQNGKYGGGNPGAASSVSIYWNALSTCGATLDTVFYTPQSARQTGATTVVEQQDAWLIRLDASPVVDDAQYAGFDATGSQVSGGYSVHHALSYNKQLTRWFGTAFASSASGVLGASFVSDLLSTVNEFGTIGPGASGAGLISTSDRLVGVLSLGRRNASVSGFGSCPVASPPIPSANNMEASFVSFASIWNSTADSSSTTNVRTLRSVLDPASTGALSVGSMQAARLSLVASNYAPAWNANVTLTWSVPNATQCTASGGSSGDGWTGMLPVSGSRSVTQNSGSDTIYRLQCNLASGGSVSGSLVLHWQPPQAQPRFTTVREYRWTTRPIDLTWQAVVGPCAISGGGLSQTGLPASGSISTTSDTAADVTYLLTCGVPGFTQTTQTVVSYVTPNLSFAVNGTRRKLGQPLELAWFSYADNCVPTGGAPGDQWTATNRYSQGYFSTQTSAVGTFTYGLNCTSGPITLQRSVQIIVDDAPPFITLIPESTSVTLSNTPSDYIRIRYSTNIASCNVSTGGFAQRPIPPVILPGPLASLTYAEGEFVLAPSGPGTFSPVFTCGGWPLAQAGPVSATTTVTVLSPAPPTATISASATHVAVGTPFTITWSSTNASNCTATSNGAPENALFWSGPLGVSGSHLVQPLQVVLNAVYSISCPSIDPSQPAATATVTVSIGPGVLLTNSNASPAVGTSFTLSWNVPTATQCNASGGGANGSPWTGTLTAVGVVTQTASVEGAHTYTLTCVLGGNSMQSSTTVTVPAAAPPPPPPRRRHHHHHRHRLPQVGVARGEEAPFTGVKLFRCYCWRALPTRESSKASDAGIVLLDLCGGPATCDLANMAQTSTSLRFIAALDQGTTSTRCILFNHEGDVVSLAQREHAQHFPQPGHVEHDALEIWRNAQAVMAEALSQGRAHRARCRGPRHHQPARDHRAVEPAHGCAGAPRAGVAGHARRIAGRRLRP